MTTTVDLDTFWRDLHQSGILSEKSFAKIADAPEYSGLSGDELAQKLVHDKHLSAFQAATLIKGRWGDLVYGDYRAVRVLHIGGIGYVLLVRHKERSGWFAVKALKQNYVHDQAMVDMFRLESHAMTTLRHENIVKGLHYGPTGNDFGGNFLAMEFIAGPNLGELVALTQVTWRQACDIIAQSARGLQHTHENDLLHRDVKPGNIIVDRKGTAKLVDYGFARYVGNEPIFPMAQDRRPGTAGFVAPERLIGDKSHSFTCDIYSLGMTFYFTLTGREPFAGKDPKDTLRAQVKHQPRPIVLFNPDVPSEVNEVFLRMTAKRPSERIQTMAEVAALLEPFGERRKVEIDLRALLHARSKTYSREDIHAITTPGSVLSDTETPSHPSQIGSGLSGIAATSGLSQIRHLEDGVRRIADELAKQRAENQRLLDQLNSARGEHKHLKELEAEVAKLRKRAKQHDEERGRMANEAEEAKKTIAEMQGRCTELEGSVEKYREQVEKLTERLGELTSAVDTLKSVATPADEAKEALRYAYEEASPDQDESLEDVWTDDELFGSSPPTDDTQDDRLGS